MNSEQFIGTGTAIVTPFKENNVDFASLGKVIDFQIEGGIDYLVFLGSTGEASMVSSSEAIQILDFAVRYVAGRVPVVAGNFTGNNTREVCGRLMHAPLKGIDALLISSPAYVKPTQEGIFAHYTEIARHTDLPIILYNVPGRTSSNIASATTLRLAESSEQFIAIKEASGDMIQCEHIIANAPDHFITVSGDDPTALALCGIGGKGVISVAANAYPDLFPDMIRKALNGDFEQAQKINQKFIPLHPILYREGNPTGIKAALEHLGLCSREVRMPLLPLSDEQFLLLKSVMDNISV